VNRVPKLRKKAGLEPTDTVEVYYNVLGDVAGGDASVLQQVFTGQVWGCLLSLLSLFLFGVFSFSLLFLLPLFLVSLAFSFSFRFSFSLPAS
jgi:hypothetical protein